MKRKLTVVGNRKYVVSTVKITGNLYETAVFEIDVQHFYCAFMPDIYEIDYSKEVARFNYCGRFNAWLYHKKVCKYWDLVNIDLAEELMKHEHIRT
jgi:hypothetical protein